MRTLKLTLAYDGTRYAGWQVQKTRGRPAPALAMDGPGRSEARGQKPTIQGVLESALSRILREPVRVIGSGRTDAGVHAIAQAAHLSTRSPIARGRLLRSVNALLPPDIAVTDIEEAPSGFHARFSARRKHYRYRIHTGAVVLPFIRPYVHHVRRPLNLALMRREAQALVGTHRFRGFARLRAPGQETRRTITSVRLVRKGTELQLEIEGNGFLHTMVRSIAGTLLDIGRGRLPPGTVRRLLRAPPLVGAGRAPDRRLAGTTAPACGLTLVSVVY